MTPSAHPTEKFCKKCLQWMPLSAFGKYAQSKDGLYKWCRPCINAFRRAELVANPALHKGVYGRLKLERGEAWVKKNNHRIGFYRFRVTPQWFQGKLSEQDGKCAICGTDKEHQRWARFCIDHDHSCCGKRNACDKCRRGLLCHKCNIKLGMIEDVEWISKALAYLHRHGKSVPHYTPPI